MPKQVKLKGGKEFQFKTASTGAAQGKYEWDSWFNGDLLMIERSVMEPTGEKDEKGNQVLRVADKGKRDYEVETDAMPPKIKTAARRRYKVCQISRVDADGTRLKDALIIKARDMTPEERVAEDLKRAEEKAAKKAEEGGDDNA